RVVGGQGEVDATGGPASREGLERRFLPYENDNLCPEDTSMNKIAEIFAQITDIEHKAAVQEMKALSETGILNDGVVRNLAKRIANDVGIPSHDALRIAQNEVLRQAAYKWGGITSQSSQKDCLTYEGIASETTEDGRP